MKVFVRILVLLLVYLLTTLSSFGIITYLYNVAVLSDLKYQLYIGIGAGVLAFVFGLLLVLVKGKNGAEQTLIFEEEGDENVDFDEIPVRQASIKPETPAKPTVQPEPETVKQEEKIEVKEVHQAEIPKEISEDLTMVMEKVVEDEPQEEPYDVDEPWNREEDNEKVEKYTTSIPKVELVSPFGSAKKAETEPEVNEETVSEVEEESVPEIEEEPAPGIEEMVALTQTSLLNLNIEEVETGISENQEVLENAEAAIEEVVFDEPVQETAVEEETRAEENPEIEKEPELEPQPEKQEEKAGFTSSTYIDEEGRPQFRITNQYRTTEFTEQDVEDDGYESRADRNDRNRDILGRIVGFLAVAAVIALIYFLFTKMMG